MSCRVRVGFDERSGRYFVLGSDIFGLNVEADDFGTLVDLVREVAPDLLGASSAGSNITFERQIALV